MKLECQVCGEELKPAGDNWGVWRCENPTCVRCGKNFIPRPLQTTFTRKKKWYAKKGRAA